MLTSNQANEDRPGLCSRRAGCRRARRTGSTLLPAHSCTSPSLLPWRCAYLGAEAGARKLLQRRVHRGVGRGGPQRGSRFVGGGGRGGAGHAGAREACAGLCLRRTQGIHGGALRRRRQRGKGRQGGPHGGRLALGFGVRSGGGGGAGQRLWADKRLAGGHAQLIQAAVRRERERVRRRIGASRRRPGEPEAWARRPQVEHGAAAGCGARAQPPCGAHLCAKKQILRLQLLPSLQSWVR